MPRNGVWTMRCRCGWTHAVDLRPFSRGAGIDKGALEKVMEKAFVEHVPKTELQTGLFVDSRAHIVGYTECHGTESDDDENGSEPIWGIKGIWIVPEGVPTKLVSNYESEGIRYGIIEDGRTLPIVMVIEPNGKTWGL